MRRLAEEFRPDRLLPRLTAGSVGGIVQVLTAISFAVLLFSDHLAGQSPRVSESPSSAPSWSASSWP